MLLAQPVAKDRERPLASRLGPSEASNRAEMDLVRSSASTSLPVRLGLILPGNKRIAGASTGDPPIRSISLPVRAISKHYMCL